MTRVFLNIFSNGFHAATRRARNGARLAPTLKVTTSDAGEAVEMDNSTGIPANMRDKLFQPFFTTKPTGGGYGPRPVEVQDTASAHLISAYERTTALHVDREKAALLQRVQAPPAPAPPAHPLGKCALRDHAAAFPTGPCLVGSNKPLIWKSA
jgi:hypothetical protein